MSMGHQRQLSHKILIESSRVEIEREEDEEEKKNKQDHGNETRQGDE